MIPGLRTHGKWRARTSASSVEPLAEPETGFGGRLICPAGRDEFALPDFEGHVRDGDNRPVDRNSDRGQFPDS
jgi:hypothetical protein